MTEQTPTVIRPQSVPLSHLAQPVETRQQGFDQRNLIVAATVVGVLVIAIGFGFNYLQTNNAVGVKPSAASSATGAIEPQTSTSPEQIAPFAKTQKQRARQQAQDALAAFVEHQIQLEEHMSVDTWAQEELALALDEAQRGDVEFLAEQFAASVATYQSATARLEEIVSSADALLAQLLVSTEAFVNQRNVEAATQSIEQALAVNPASVQAQRLQRRVAGLPKIISLLRDAKNHELGGRPQQALDVYAQIAQLDPEFDGLGPLQATAKQDFIGKQIAQHLTRGFKHLDDRKFDRAKLEFKKVLHLKPANEVALGGLAEVTKRNDLAIIRQHQQVAQNAITTEDWQTAIDAYTAVLALDANIQFAQSGLQSSQAHYKTSELLAKISAQPERLSSEKLYLQAVTIVDRARLLELRGAKLNTAIDDVSVLISLYRDPVDVVLLSDDATDIIVSNVGRLGTFARKTLKLRPGQYTIRGSQNGCRDIYLSIQVLPGIEPVQLSCTEKL